MTPACARHSRQAFVSWAKKALAEMSVTHNSILRRRGWRESEQHVWGACVLLIDDNYATLAMMRLVEESEG